MTNVGILRWTSLALLLAGALPAFAQLPNSGRQVPGSTAGGSRATQSTTERTNAAPVIRGEREETRDVANYASDETIKDESRPTGTGVSIYLGLDLGIAQVLSHQKETESDKFGYHFAGKGLLTLFTNDILLDLGGGLAYNQVSGDRDVEELSDGSRSEIANPSITTTSAFLEFSPRLRLGDNVQIGPIGQDYVGTDSSFALPGAQERNAVFAGVALLWDGGNDVLWRAGVQAFTDVNLHERDVYLGMLTLQVGLPIVKQKTIVRDRRYLSVKENVRTQQVERKVDRIVIKENVRFLFEEQIINFEFDRSILSRRSEYFLSELARFLVANPGIFENVVVEGHTDTRGSHEYNMKLSDDRAASVRLALQKNGVSPGRIRSQGFGFTRQIDPNSTELAHARNRRVEMAFGGVRDPNKLREAINRIKDQVRVMPR
jgi:outer membrane protein OmpA-like peptidoglycan-associated protein